ncbi:MAG: ribosomal-processing cysteine protease Prp [Clostridiales bacterium]|nr:ribosomal-processing cysteine protease Prp [Clostridiales bacterium]
MIRVLIERDEVGRVARMTVEGHAGMAPKGADVVCAAASAIAQTAVLGVEGQGIPAQVEKREGFLRLEVSYPPGGRSVGAAAILEAAATGLKVLSEENPKHVRYGEKEKG